MANRSLHRGRDETCFFIIIIEYNLSGLNVFGTFLKRPKCPLKHMVVNIITVSYFKFSKFQTKFQFIKFNYRQINQIIMLISAQALRQSTVDSRYLEVEGTL